MAKKKNTKSKKKNKNLENFKASVKYDIVMKKAIDEVVKNSKNA